MNVTHTQADMFVVSLNYGCECHNSIADMVIIIEDMATNTTHTQADMFVLSLKIWL